MAQPVFTSLAFDADRTSVGHRQVVGLGQKEFEKTKKRKRGEKKATPNETKRNGLGPAAVEPVAGFDNSSDTEKKTTRRTPRDSEATRSSSVPPSNGRARDLHQSQSQSAKLGKGQQQPSSALLASRRSTQKKNKDPANVVDSLRSRRKPPTRRGQKKKTFFLKIRLRNSHSSVDDFKFQKLPPPSIAGPVKKKPVETIIS